MKTVVKFVLVAMLLVMAGCGSSGNASYPEGSLEAQLNAISGVRVTGTGDYARVVLKARRLSGAREGQSIEGKAKDDYRESYSRPPLFVVDGQPIGRDFQQVKDLVWKREIESAKLLSHNMAIRYGKEESYYGVIEITTKSKSSISEEEKK